MSKADLELLLTKDVSYLDNKQLWIWGTGNTAQMYQEGLLRWSYYRNVAGYTDGNPEKWGKQFCGKKIVSPKELKNMNNVFVLICSNQINYINEISKQLEELELDFALLDEIALVTCKEQVLKSYEIMETQKSKDLYEYLVRCKMKGIYPSAESGLLDIYHGYFSVPQMLAQRDDEVFLDIGCYTGDTIKEFLDKNTKFDKIISFEPDLENYEKAKKNIETYCRDYKINNNKILLYPYGVGAQSVMGGFERFEETNGEGSKFISNNDGAGNDMVKLVSIDEFIEQKYTILKADVESFEYQVLVGARKSIKKWKPRLAICVYHNIFDFIQLPLLIKEFVPDYKINICQHAASWYDTVIYAWV